MLQAPICSSSGCVSVQHSEGDSVRVDMNELSVQSDEDKIEQESVYEIEQQVSNDEEKNTPLARRTRSARASKPSRFVLPLAIVQDESDDEFVDRSHNMIPKGKPTNKKLPSSTQETPCGNVCFGYSDLTLPSLLTAPAGMWTVSGRDTVDRPTHELC
jgi:hypothetical protein